MKKNDGILIGVFLLIGIICIIGINLMNHSGASVIVTVDGKEYGTYSLAEDATIAIISDYGSNRLVIQNNTATVTDASCPDKICVHEKSINKTGETIVCLPNKMVVTVINGEENELDAVTQ
ncbi:MAG: NusG domain II-containing protein [Lachnotalea sp.]